MSYGNSRIRRGSIAADRFTQVSNALFRDTRITLKAKGLFGLLSTHRDGYGVTAALISRQCKESIDAVQSGLRELEKFGYLERERERRPDGTRGAVEYFITDAPAEAFEQENSRSEPEPGFPVLDEPVLDDPATKNTNPKKTNNQNTNPVRPSVNARTRARNNGRTDGRDAPHDTTPTTPGTELLLTVGREHPLYLLTGPALADQGRKVDGLLGSWTAEQIRVQLTGRPLPTRDEIKRSPGAVISARLDELAKVTPLGAQATPEAARPQMPPACPDHLGPALPMRMREDTEGRPYKCPDCHPYAAQATSPAF